MTQLVIPGTVVSTLVSKMHSINVPLESRRFRLGIIEALTEAVSIGVSKLSNFSEDRGGSEALKTGSVLFSGAAWIVFASPIIGALFLLSVNVGSLGFFSIIFSDCGQGC